MKSETLNAPFEVLIGEKKYEVRQLSISSIFSIIEKFVKSKKIAEAKEFADLLQGNEKQAFLLKAWNTLPTGADLQDLTMDIIQSAEGIVLILKEAILKSNKKLNSEELAEEIKDSITLETLEEYAKIVFRILGLNEDNTSTDNTDDKKK